MNNKGLEVCYGKFFDIGAEARLGQDNKLVKLSKLLNWEKIERALSKVHE